MAVAVGTEIMREPKQLTSDKSRFTNLLLFALLAIALVGGVGYYLAGMRTPKLINTEYQAVLLDNGAAYFGKMIPGLFL